MKRILFVVEDITFSGGLENVVLTLANYFVDNNIYHVDILSLKEKNQRFYECHEAVTLYSLDIEHYKHKSGIFSFRNIYTYTDKNKNKFNAFFDEYSCDVAVATTYSIASLLNSTNANMAKVVWEHTHFYGYCDPKQYYAGFKGLIKEIVNKLITHPQRAKLYNKLDAVVVLTEKDKILWDKLHSNVIAINNPLTLKPTLAERSETSKTTRVVSVGRLTEQKGFEYLIEAIYLINKNKLIDDLKLYIVGDGQLKEELANKINHYKLNDKVFLLGRRKDINMIFSDSDIYVSSAVYEGFGLTMVEAQSHGLPVIAFDCLAGPAEILKPDCGILIENRNVEQLSDAIKLLATNVALRNKMSDAALENVKKFDIKKISEIWVDHLDGLINERC